MKSDKKASGHEVMRRCVGCGVSKDKKGLIRIVKSKDGEVKFDPSGHAAGRGAYVCLDPECLKKAIERRGLERSFGCMVSEEARNSLREEFGKLDIR
ncbi:hypothetical protein SAMN05216390_101427 [Lachnospiraceae bacterium KH1T2]|nr:hypothetical protein SAMN05216390_101427 [Lachnospiraceae bacterium KH1T2]